MMMNTDGEIGMKKKNKNKEKNSTSVKQSLKTISCHLIYKQKIKNKNTPNE
jgi:hypothetical protein